MTERESEEGSGETILQDAQGSLLRKIEIVDRTIYSGRPGTIWHELAYLASLPETPRRRWTYDPVAEADLQKQFREVILPLHRRLTQG